MSLSCTCHHNGLHLIFNQLKKKLTDRSFDRTCKIIFVCQCRKLRVVELEVALLEGCILEGAPLEVMDLEGAQIKQNHENTVNEEN